MIDVIAKAAIVLLGVPVVGQAATQDSGVWSDPQTWVGAGVLILLTQGDKILTAGRERWARRSMTTEQIEAQQRARDMTETERLQARVDELISAAMTDRDAEIARLRAELVRVQLEREEYRDQALKLARAGDTARAAKARETLEESDADEDADES